MKGTVGWETDTDKIKSIHLIVWLTGLQYDPEHAAVPENYNQEN